MSTFINLSLKNAAAFQIKAVIRLSYSRFLNDLNLLRHAPETFVVGWWNLSIFMRESPKAQT
jgi:hypothetical protein